MKRIDRIRNIIDAERDEMYLIYYKVHGYGTARTRDDQFDEGLKTTEQPAWTCGKILS